MSARRIVLAFSGDLAPLVHAAGVEAADFSELGSVLKACDVHVTNLECPLTSSSTAIIKTGPALKAPPQGVEVLRKAGANVVCMANNHIFDYGEAGLRETIRVCEGKGIETLGIVKRPDDRDPWLTKEVKEKKIGILNYCEHEFSTRGEGEVGASGYDPIVAFDEIQTLRPMVDYLIVIYHGGNELYPLPRPGLKRTFHMLVDMGADAVIGHHSHVISGYEIYKGKPLVYGLGNFFFPYEGEPEEWYIGLLCRITIDETVQVELVPIEQCRSGFAVKPLLGEEKTKIMAEIDRLSNIIINDQALLREWRKFACANKKQLMVQMPGIGRLERVLMKLGMPAERVIPRSALLSALNRRRCQSHHDLMIAFMEEMLK